LNNIEAVREYCLSKKGVEETFPFDNDTLVFKVLGKMFLLTSLTTSPFRFNVKCDPIIAIELREQYPFIIPGFHMDKTHWNTITISENVSPQFVANWIDHSYELVIRKMSKKTQALLK